MSAYVTQLFNNSPIHSYIHDYEGWINFRSNEEACSRLLHYFLLRQFICGEYLVIQLPMLYTLANIVCLELFEGKLFHINRSYQMKVILPTMGSPGDVLPSVFLGAYLKEKGCEVHILAGSGFQAMAENFGLIFHPIANTGANSKVVNDPGFSRQETHMALVADIFLRAIDPFMEYAKEHNEPGNTIIMAPARIMGARLSSELYKIPLVSYQLQPSFLDSFDSCNEESVEKALAAPLGQVRKKLGLPTLKTSVLKWLFSPQTVLGYFPKWFADLQSTHTPHMKQLGFLQWFGETSPLAPPIQEFLDAGDPPILFSAGTTSQKTLSFYSQAVEICEELGVRAIFAPFDSAKMSKPLPPSIMSMAWAPFQALLPKVAAVVHPGGIGATAEAIRAGVPQLLFGFAQDQPDNGVRVELAGAGKGIFSHAYENHHLRTSALANGIREIISTPQMTDRCKKLAENFKDPTLPYSQTWDILQEVLANQPSLVELSRS